MALNISAAIIYVVGKGPAFADVLYNMNPAKTKVTAIDPVLKPEIASNIMAIITPMKPNCCVFKRPILSIIKNEITRPMMLKISVKAVLLAALMLSKIKLLCDV